MKRIFEIVLPHWRVIVVAGLCSVVVSSINGSFAWVVKPVVDDIFVEGDRGHLVLIALAVAAAFLLRGLFTYFQNYLMDSVGAKIVRDVRSSLYARMVHLPMSYYGGDSTGSMMSKILNDAGTLQALLAFRVKDLFVSSGTIIILTGVAMYRRWDLTLISLTVLPFAFYTIGRLGKRLKRVTREAQKKLASITESLAESIQGIKIIKSFSMEQKETGRFRDKTQDYYREFMRSIRIVELTSLVMEVLAGAGVAFIIYYGGTLVSSKAMTTGDFFSFLAAILLIYTPAKRLAQVNNGFQQAKAYLGRIDDILHAEPEADGSIELGQIKQGIAFRDVCFRYEGREDYALGGVSLDINKGEVVALVGRSGSGKTTLVDLLARFYVPESGSISIDGADISKFTASSLRSKFGLVSQNVILFNDTVMANIAYSVAGEAIPEDVIRAAKAAYAHEFISALPQGYDTYIGEGGARMSGGQRQRISIARAIFSDPEILVLDEATSSLDTQSEQMVQRALDNLLDGRSHEIGGPGSGGDRTVIVIAHRLSTVKRADRILVLDKGEVAEEGTHESLLRSDGIYSHLYKLQHGDEMEHTSRSSEDVRKQ